MPLGIENGGHRSERGRPGCHHPYPRPEPQLPETEPGLVRKRASILCPALGTTITSMSPSPCSPSSRWEAGGGAHAVSPAPGRRGLVPVPSTAPGAGQCLALPCHPTLGHRDSGRVQIRQIDTRNLIFLLKLATSEKVRSLPWASVSCSGTELLKGWHQVMGLAQCHGARGACPSTGR